jgi:hypothetical protein
MDIQNRTVGSFFNGDNSSYNLYSASVIFITALLQKYPNFAVIKDLDQKVLQDLAHIAWNCATSLITVADEVTGLAYSEGRQGGVGTQRRTA